MNENEQLRAELNALRDGTRKALALLAHAAGSTQDVRPLLANLQANYKSAMTNTSQADDFDSIAAAMLLSLSSLAIKQHPGDSELLALYQGLRQGSRH